MKNNTCLIVLGLIAAPCLADGEIANGWRGNGTGRFPDSTAPLVWGRTPRGVIADLRVRDDRPTGDTVEGAVPLARGIVPKWLVVGPFPLVHSLKDIDQESLPGEKAAQPSAGDRVGELAWKPVAADVDDRFKFGVASTPACDLGKAVGAKPNQATYAHAYLHSPKGGTVRAVVDHMFGMKAWLNGEVVYREPDRRYSLGTYYPLSRVEVGSMDPNPAASFELKLRPGWNRLLVKLTTFWRADPDWKNQDFSLRLMEAPGVAHDETNILWKTELPQRSNATPLVVGDRVFVMAEPDELICLEKQSGKILWSAATNLYEMLTPAERAANPAFAEKVDPLIAALKTEPELTKRLKLRNKIQASLVAIDEDRFAWNMDGHYSSHFGIMGFTTPTPVSDGKHIWVWCGNGVGACYDMAGKRVWTQRPFKDQLNYTSSPALADGVFGVYHNRLIGLDAATGAVRWQQKKINLNYAAILAARIAKTPVFVTSAGHVVRARDGHILYFDRDRAAAGSTWTAPVVQGDTVYLLRFGATHLQVLDFSAAEGDEWTPKTFTIHAPDGISKHSSGKSYERSTTSSPLVVGDLVYTLDIYSTLYAFDVKAKKLLYHQETALDGLFHYNAVPVAASAALVGTHVVIADNQGVSLVLEPGPTFKQVRKNHLATQIDRFWPLPAQETIGNSPLVADGPRLYIRGERYLYCIGEK